jgi:hypothetical protein
MHSALIRQKYMGHFPSALQRYGTVGLASFRNKAQLSQSVRVTLAMAIRRSIDVPGNFGE